MSSVVGAAPVTAHDLAELLIEVLEPDGLTVADVDVDAPIYGDGLGLDSLEILELALGIQQRYGVQLRADTPESLAVFASLRALAGHVNVLRGAPG